MAGLKAYLVGLLLALAMLAGGCGPPPAPSPDARETVSLWVTRDFGEEILFSSELEMAPGQSVLALLQAHLEVETAYGGGFVNAINGLESGSSGQRGGEGSQMVDWFYYVNGILSSQGAGDYIPGSGDVIWWDYRPWGDIAFTPAVVGAFPQPFVGGYMGKDPGISILAGDGCRELAEQLAGFLGGQGAGDIEVAAYREEDAVNRSRMTIVVAPWEQLHESPFWAGIQQHRDRTGWFAELTPRGFYPLDVEARPPGSGYGEKAGAVLATGTGLGDPHPLWLVTGTDADGLAGALEALITRPEAFEKAVGALVVDGEVIRVPRDTP